MARRLNTFVYVPDKDGVPVGFGPADDVPDWVAELITNPDVWVPDDVPGPDAEVSSNPVKMLAVAGATDDEIATFQAMLDILSDEQRAAMVEDAPSQDEVREFLAEWRRATEDNGGDLAAALEALEGDDGGSTGGGTSPVPPPRTGAGSGREAWIEYARLRGLTIDDEARREDVIDALMAAGIPVE